MTKILKGTRMPQCTGCGLCELLASRITKDRHGYTEGPVAIRQAASGQPFFRAVIDYGQKTDYPQVRDICPENCYDIVEE